MTYCSQVTITDAAFVHLRGIQSLNMNFCTLATITDTAFVRDLHAQHELLHPGDHHGRGLCVPARDEFARHGCLQPADHHRRDPCATARDPQSLHFQLQPRHTGRCRGAPYLRHTVIEGFYAMVE